MKKFKIALLPADGVGGEVVDEGVKVLDKAAELSGDFSFEYTTFPWGSDYYLEHGEMMPEDALEQLKEFDAIILGAVGDPRVPDHVTLWGMLLPIRKKFDQYVNVRPIRLIDGVPNILADTKREDINMTFIRENTEGEYSDSGAWLYRDKPNEVVIQNNVFSRVGTERVIRYAFELAQKENKSVTNVTKSNAQQFSMVFWDQIFNEVAEDYPDVATHRLLVDAAAMHMIRDPKRFEVVVTSNLFGDILTDIGAAISGGMGMAAGANLNPTGEFPSMFEPIHGSAPDIAGQGIANPLATIWTAAQMIEFLGYKEVSDKILIAIENLTREGRTLTKDLAGTASTSQVGDALVAELEKVFN